MGLQEFLLFKLLGGLFGWGLKRNVIELYKFLCRNYVRNDKIFLFGFSRGAFTVRVLAGLIDTCGLFTEFESEHDLNEFARRSYAIYRKEKHEQWRLSTLLAWIWDCLNCTRGKDYASGVDTDIKIEFIGVWDTVNAYGIPNGFKLRDLWDRYIFPLRFNDRKLSDKVRRACHALSIDNERQTFDDGLHDTAASGVRLLVSMLVPFQAANVRFIGFNRSAEHRHFTCNECSAKPVHQVPGRLLRDLQVPMQPHQGHAFQVHSQQVDGNRPIRVRQFRTPHDGSGLEA